MRRIRNSGRVAFAAVFSSAVLGGAALVLVPAASASRVPTAGEAKEIGQAVQGFYSQWYYPVSSSTLVKVSGVRVSSADPAWASAYVSGPKAAGRNPLTGPYRVVLLWHAPGSPGATDGPGGRRWIVAEAGVGMGEFFGCAIAPDAVNADLFRSMNGGC